MTNFTKGSAMPGVPFSSLSHLGIDWSLRFRHWTFFAASLSRRVLALETAEAVATTFPPGNTPLKRGVNHSIAAKGLHRAQKVKGSQEIVLGASFIEQPAEQQQIIYCFICQPRLKRRTKELRGMTNDEARMTK